MKSQHHLNSRQGLEQHQSTAEQKVNTTPLEFGTADELLRHDALHTPVPPTVAFRLAKSLGPVPSPRRPWWRRLLGQ